MRKKRIGVLTLNGYYNYGNRLQNYALEQSILKMGLDVNTILVNRSRKGIKKYFTNKSSLLTLGNRIFNIDSYFIKFSKASKTRKSIFMDFTKSNIRETEFTLSKDNIPKDLLKQYDYFVVGSDQVWNPNNLHGTDFYFLTFAEKAQRVSYSASFGLNSIPKDYIEKYRHWLNGMNFISVREYSGAQIVERLTDKKCQVHVDPTMLLNKEEWIKISKRAKNRPDKPYLLTYFLGGPPPKLQDKIKKIAIDNQMEIINLGDKTEKDSYQTGPSEFIDYINNASAFFTDSFHGTVFSIILQTPFKVYERISSGPSMYSRIETILKKFGLEDRDGSNYDNDLFSVDFTNSLEVLENEQIKSINYLKKAFEVEET